MQTRNYRPITLHSTTYERLQLLAEEIARKQNINTERKRELSKDSIIDFLLTFYDQRKASADAKSKQDS